MEDDLVAPASANPEKFVGTADVSDQKGGLAATADPTQGTVPSTACDSSDDDEEYGSWWTGSSDNWAGICSPALGLANPMPSRSETSMPAVATFVGGRDVPVLAFEMLAAGVYSHTVSCEIAPANRKLIR